MSRFLERYKPGQATQQGTIGRTFTAIDLQDNKPVVIKHIGCAGVEAAAAVLQEWARLLPVRHSTLIEVYETELDELNFYLAVQYLEGNNLRRLLSSLPQRAEQRDGLERLLWMARTLLEGLSQLHSAELAHGDLCPENVWVNERVLILDSGLARLERLAGIPDDPRLKSALQAIPIGSPNYRAPELALGGMPSFASDMYSLGVILHESLSGRLPGAEGPVLPDKLAEQELLFTLVSKLLDFRPHERLTLPATMSLIDEILQTPPELVRRLEQVRKKSGSGKLESQEVEIYQARAALLLETDAYQRVLLHRAIAANFARKMRHSEALEECQAGYEDIKAISEATQAARANAELVSVEMQICFNQARFAEMPELGRAALAKLEMAGLDTAKIKEAARIWIKLARFYYRRSMLTELGQTLKLARTSAEASQYFAGLAEANIVEAMYYGWTKGQVDAGIAAAERSLQTAKELDIEWLQSEAHRVIGGCYQYKNEIAESRRHYQLALELAQQAGLADLIAAALYNLGLICEIEGDFAGCEKFFLQSLEIARKAKIPRPQAIAYKGLDLLYIQLGRLPEAYEQARLHLRLMQEMADQQLLPDAYCQMAQITLEMGRLDESERYINSGRELALSTGNNLILVELEELAATLRLRQNQLDEAEQILAANRVRAGEQFSEWLVRINRTQLEIDLARLQAESGTTPAHYAALIDRSAQLLADVRVVKPSFEAGYLALHGRLLALANQWEEAEAVFKQAIQRADELKQRLSLALALDYYGRSLLEKVQTGRTTRLGQRGRAMGLLANAKAVYAECAAQPGLDSVNLLLQQSLK